LVLIDKIFSCLTYKIFPGNVFSLRKVGVESFRIYFRI